MRAARCWRFVMKPQQAAPVCAITFSTLLYLLNVFISAPPFIVIAPTVGMIALSFALSKSRDQLQFIGLGLSLLWMFVLWYAMLRYSSNATATLWSHQAIYVSIVGATLTTSTLVRIGSRLRITGIEDNKDFEVSSRWGLSDLMTLSFSAALISAALRLRGDVATVAMACFVSSCVTLSIVGSWASMSKQGIARIPLTILMAWVQAWISLIAINFAMENYWKFDAAMSLWRFPRTESVTLESGLCWLTLTLPVVFARYLGHRAIFLAEKTHRNGYQRVWQTLSHLSLTVTPLLLMLCIALVPWRSNHQLVRVGWPCYFWEACFRSVGTGATQQTLRHTASESSGGFLINLGFLLAPVLFWRVVAKSGKSRHSTARYEKPWKATVFAWCWLFLVYIGPSIIAQFMANAATDRMLLQSVSWLTQFDVNESYEGYSIAINDLSQLEEMLSAPGGIRTATVELRNINIGPQHLERLAENHCLVKLVLSKCEVEGGLSPLLQLPFLESLTFDSFDFSAQDIDVISRLSALRSLEIDRPSGSKWHAWPSKLEFLQIGCDRETSQQWELKDMPLLREFYLEQSESEWNDSDATYVVHPERRFRIDNCGSLYLFVDATLPIHLHLRSTSLISLRTRLVLGYLADTPHRIPHKADLRSFSCDDISNLESFEATVENCESFTLPNTKASQTRCRIELFGTSLPPINREYTSSANLPEMDFISAAESEEILDVLMRNVSPADLVIVGMTVDKSLFDRLRSCKNLVHLDLQCEIVKDGFIDALCTSVGALGEFRMIGYAPDESEVAKLLGAFKSTPQVIVIESKNLEKLTLPSFGFPRSLCLVGKQCPEIPPGELAKLKRLVLGPRYAPSLTYDHEGLVARDINVPLDLVQDWQATHSNASMIFENCFDSLDVFRGFDFSRTNFLSFFRTPPDREIINSWKISDAYLALHFTGQTLEQIQDSKLIDWLNNHPEIDAEVTTEGSPFHGFHEY